MKQRQKEIDECLEGVELFSDESSKALFTSAVRLAFAKGEEYYKDNQ